MIELFMGDDLTEQNVTGKMVTAGLAAAFDLLPYMVFVKDRHFRVCVANNRFCEFTGASREDILGKTAFDLYPPDVAQVFQEMDEKLVATRQTVRNEEWIVSKDGTRRLLDTIKVPVFDDQDSFRGIFAISSDITQQNSREMERDTLISSLRDTLEMLQKQSDALKKLNNQLQDMAITDALTQVANRRFFDRQYDVEWRRCRRDKKPLALMLIDVDHFKCFNDQFGHPAGDDCLRRVAAALNGQISRPGDVLARYGGEEFVAILPDTKDHLEKVASRCLKAVQDEAIPHSGNADHKVVTVSIGGVVGYPHHLSSPLDLLDLADQHLYLAKQRGRNTFTLMGEKARAG